MDGAKPEWVGEEEGDGTPMPSEAELVAVIAQSRREIDAGLTVPLSEVLADLDAVIATMAKRADASPR